jgi:hypothetical protein
VAHRLHWLAGLAELGDLRIAGKQLGRATQPGLVANHVSVAVPHGKAELGGGGGGTGTRNCSLDQLELGSRAQRCSIRCGREYNVAKRA